MPVSVISYCAHLRYTITHSHPIKQTWAQNILITVLQETWDQMDFEKENILSWLIYLFLSLLIADIEVQFFIGWVVYKLL